jgi:hypothetical protein
MLLSDPDDWFIQAGLPVSSGRSIAQMIHSGIEYNRQPPFDAGSPGNAAEIVELACSILADPLSDQALMQVAVNRELTRRDRTRAVSPSTGGCLHTVEAIPDRVAR